MRKLVAWLVLVLSAMQGTACINEYYTAKADGSLVRNEDVFYPSVPKARLSKEQAANQLKKARKAYQRYPDYKHLSDLGAALLFNGRYQEAKKLFANLEQEHPGLYATAANLGTAYELLGQPDSALYWIARAIHINPASHHGSEWLHQRLLQQKVAGKTTAVTGLDFGNEAQPITAISNDSLLLLEQQLTYQLTERLYFVKAPDAYVAAWLFDLANIRSLTQDVQRAMPVYEEARRFGYGGQVFDARYQYMNQLIKKAEQRTRIAQWMDDHIVVLIITILFFSVVVLIFMLIRFWHRRQRKRKSAL